jgi:hypothetical protein
MVRRIACVAVLFLVVLLAAACPGEERPAPGNLLARTTWARLEIVFGRLQLTRVRLGQESRLSANKPDAGVEETLSFSARTANSARLRYDYLDERQHLILDVEQPGQVILERRPQEDSDVVAVQFRQPLRGDLTLTVEDGDRPRRFVAESFWHLMLAEPEACRSHLVPLLQSLRTDWLLAPQAQQVEDALFAAAGANRLPDVNRMDRLVKQLNDPKFSRRQAADRELRMLGQTSLAYLSRLDERTLDVEQRTRIREIKRALLVQDGDTPLRVAAWLAADQAIWVALLDTEQESKRMLAASRLEAIVGESLAFDPSAGEDERRRQIGRLRIELGLERPILVGEKDGETFRR